MEVQREFSLQMHNSEVFTSAIHDSEAEVGLKKIAEQKGSRVVHECSGQTDALV